MHTTVKERPGGRVACTIQIEHGTIAQPLKTQQIDYRTNAI